MTTLSRYNAYFNYTKLQICQRTIVRKGVFCQTWILLIYSLWDAMHNFKSWHISIMTQKSSDMYVYYLQTLFDFMIQLHKFFYTLITCCQIFNSRQILSRVSHLNKMIIIVLSYLIKGITMKKMCKKKVENRRSDSKIRQNMTRDRCSQSQR